MSATVKSLSTYPHIHAVIARAAELIPLNGTTRRSYSSGVVEMLLNGPSAVEVIKRQGTKEDQKLLEGLERSTSLKGEK